MFGMDSMSSAVAPLSNDPNFANLLTVFNNPVFGIIAGALLTAIIQSSSASVGILQALSKTGAITYSMAIPIVMGQNIGTCVTALISCIGAKKNAKRAALVHLYFNIIGTLVICALFYGSNLIFQYGFLTMKLPRQISLLSIQHLTLQQQLCYFLLHASLKNSLALQLRIRKKKVKHHSSTSVSQHTFTCNRPCFKCYGKMARLSEGTLRRT